MTAVQRAALGMLLIWLLSAIWRTPAAVAQNRPETSAARGQPTALPRDWPDPVNDRAHYTFLLADVLEYQPGTPGNFNWDVEGWHGGDYNRFWFMSEGQVNSAFTADYDLDLQLLYGRFVWKWYDFLIGARVQTQSFRGGNETRGLAAIGLVGLVPYSYEVESELFVDQDANISARVTATKDLLLTQRLILQPRLETNAAVQRVERFTTGSGLNNLELGFRLRYEIWRKFGPYVGVSFDWSVFGTADLVRQNGGDPNQARVVAGARVWR